MIAEILHMRAERAHESLVDEIEHSSASPQEKAFLRQKLAHLWLLVKPQAEVKER